MATTEEIKSFHWVMEELQSQNKDMDLIGKGVKGYRDWRRRRDGQLDLREDQFPPGAEPPASNRDCWQFLPDEECWLRLHSVPRTQMFSPWEDPGDGSNDRAPVPNHSAADGRQR